MLAIVTLKEYTWREAGIKGGIYISTYNLPHYLDSFNHNHEHFYNKNHNLKQISKGCL